MGVPLKGTLDSIDLGLRFAKEVGCGDDDVACVRGKVYLISICDTNRTMQALIAGHGLNCRC